MAKPMPPLGIFCLVFTMLLLSLASVVAFIELSSAVPLSPAEMQAKLGLGINLGNRLDLAGQPAREVKEGFFDAYKAKGFTNVRIPVCWDGHTSQTAPYTVDPKFLDSVAQYVGWSMSRGMVTILNTHHEVWLDTAGSEFSSKLPRLEAIWTQIADRFAGANETLLFEVFNEPHAMTQDQLNQMNNAIVPIIRKKHPTRIIFLQGLKFGNPSWILQNPTGMQFPAGDKQMMLEIHNYDPFPYAGGKPSLHSWGSDADKAALQQWADGIDTWSKNNSIPLYYGEFGCTNDQTAATGRDKWFQAHADIIKSKGWGASVWSDGGGHLVYNYNDGTWVEDILNDLGKNPPTPPPAPPAPTPAGTCTACGYSCDAHCVCGRCNTKPGCDSETQCLGTCNGGGNAKWCGGGAVPTPAPGPGPVTPTPPPTPAGFCNECGYACDDNCICGHCNTKPGCESETQCLGSCNSGGNAKWCGGGAVPTPAPGPGPVTPTPPPTPAGFCNECGYACDDNCICGHCNTKPGCESETQCLGSCNSGGNAKWCGGGVVPTPALPTPAAPTPATPTPAPGPAPSGCPGGSLKACIGLCPTTPPAGYKACVESCEARCK